MIVNPVSFQRLPSSRVTMSPRRPPRILALTAMAYFSRSVMARSPENTSVSTQTLDALAAQGKALIWLQTLL
jgi:hypothetical protein